MTSGASLESVMFRLVDYLSKEKADCYDTMLMISLVNLLGIVSAVNKQAPSAVSPAAAPTQGDPLVASLMNMLGEGRMRQGGPGGGPPIDPAMLMSLLGNRGQRPENALLMTLLSSLMQQPPQGPPPQGPPPQGPPPQGKGERGRFSRTEGTKAAAGGQKEPDGQEGVITWDRRLG